MSIRFTSKNIKKKILATLVASALSPSLWADSPPNIMTDIKWTYNGNDIHSPSTPPPTNFGSNSIPLATERAIYQWIYDDASSAWGHREMALLQDQYSLFGVSLPISQYHLDIRYYLLDIFS